MQNDPDQVAEAMRNGPGRFVVSEPRHETTIDDLEEASFVFDGVIGSLIENTAHLTVALSGGCKGGCLGSHFGVRPCRYT